MAAKPSSAISKTEQRPAARDPVADGPGKNAAKLFPDWAHRPILAPILREDALIRVRFRRSEAACFVGCKALLAARIELQHMTIPDYQTIMLPLLRFLADGRERSLGEAVEAISD